MTVYISGRITGGPGYREKFREAEDRLFGAGYTPVNPCHFVRDGEEWKAAIRYTLPFMLKSGGVALLPGWKGSKGAKIEARLARETGIPARPLEEWIKEPAEEWILRNKQMRKNNRPISALPLLLCALCASCATADMEKRVKADAKAGLKTGGPPVLVVPVEMPPPEVQVVEVEKPVYVPEPAPAPKQAQGRAAVEAANTAGIVKPSEYSRAAMVYDYNRDWVYEVYAQPLRVCDVRLEPGEKAAEAPFVSDSERWMLGAGVSYENGVAVQHIYVKPVERGLEASLIINTDKRTYHLILRSFTDVFMPMVRWRYPSAGLPENYAAPAGGTAESAGRPPGTAAEAADTGVDPRFLSFNYRVVYGLFNKPKWLPKLVYDDGKKTYVTFPEDVLQSELPAVFENRSDVVNYRVLRNIIIIDKLIEAVTVKMGKTEISIEKKKG
jgi:type IV secretion system protein VirB9